MARKPNSMYRRITQHAYTRREYMGGVPMNRINQYEMGDRVRPFSVKMELVAEERCHVRHIAMESARVSISRHLEKAVGKGNFYAKFRIYPHHVLRENKQATGAGADRVSMGMRLAFGKHRGDLARNHPKYLTWIAHTPTFSNDTRMLAKLILWGEIK
jgi:large subunit ribosomal protein L10e